MKFDHSNNDGESEAGHDTSNKEESQEGKAYVEDKKLTAFVWCMNVSVVLILIGAAVGTAVALYKFVSNTEQSAFESDFEADAAKIFASLGQSVDLTLTALDSYTTTIVSYAHDTNQTWPFVTLPDVELRMSKVRSLSKASYMTHYPFVTSADKEKWEAFADENNIWVNESIAIQESDPNFYGPILEDFYTVGIHDWDEEPVEREYGYLPEWMSSPSIPTFAPYNWDALSWTPNASAVRAVESRLVQVTETYLIPDPNDPEAMEQYESTLDWISNYTKPGQDPAQPLVDVFYPILNNVNQAYIGGDVQSHAYSGIVMVTIFWNQWLEDILPTGSDGVVIVLDNPCTASCTFEFQGPRVEYLGRGDLHDPAYDKYELKANLFELELYSTSQSYYTGVLIDTEYCQHSFRVYPSTTMQERYTSNLPIIMACVAVGIFLGSAVVYLLYTVAVEHRQKQLLNKATKTSAIVSSLFPAAVRDRLVEQEEAKAKLKKSEKRNAFMANTHTTSFDNVFSTSSPFLQEQAATQSIEASPPIAELLPNTTVFFADLAGFTKWSSSRSPTEVFQLLETVYGAMDRCARRRRVFKVETIGDCYMAATGVPRAQKGHAVIMVRFARECQRHIDLLKEDLCEKLGEDTRDLDMRIGIHSGPTTAGVLRGDKGRFQLFGDTVNTASRMESCGVKGRIHVSQETANELMAVGKGSWLEPREDKIVAKGKGELQTFFVKKSTGGSESCCTSDTHSYDDLESIHGMAQQSDGDGQGHFQRLSPGDYEEHIEV